MRSAERFSDRVDNYIRYRPGYPPEVLELFRREMALTPVSVVADVGSGTGISARMFLENGNTVFGVEPNAPMREAAERLLADFPNFRSDAGTAENTTLPDASTGIVTAAQAFHWFDPETTRPEFLRILKPGGFIALIWNERQLDSTPFLREYEAFLLKWATDYQRVRHENIDEEKLGGFFRGPYERAEFPNVQRLDFDGLKGRLASSSYMPNESDPRFPELERNLRILFDKHSENGRIEVLYDTRIYYQQV
jgi:SAM-dependent methyltransferase